MSTNRPFFANFLAAFRAHSALQQASSTSSTSGSASSASSVVQAARGVSTGRGSTIGPTNPRSIPTKSVAGAGPTSTAVQAAGDLQSSRQHPSSSLSRSPISPPAPSGTSFGSKTTGQRRDSSSSTEGFREALGSEKWFIGGRTPAGEERFYRLGMAKRQRSIDRLSLDRLSL